jgi:hypothetical protein
MYQAYALRPIGTQILFNPGGAVDQFFYSEQSPNDDQYVFFHAPLGTFEG